jgi:hypothetical protein
VLDLLSDYREVIRRGKGSELRRSLLLRKLAKFERACREVGSDINRPSEPGKHPQQSFIRLLCEDGHGQYRELMFQFVCARLIRGDFSDWTGWEYRNEWAIGSYSPEIPNRRWRLEPVKSIAVLGEQGIGDEIMFGSCIPDVPAKVVFECDPRLVDVFSRSLRIECKPRQDIVDRGEPIVKYLTLKRDEDAFIPVGDLPRLFRKSRGAFPSKPFLKPRPEYVEKWKHLRGRVGVAWRSRTGQVRPEEFGVSDPVCVQYDAWPYETEGMSVPECDLRDGIEDLLGICANLERVVSVPQTIVHIAGAVGCKVDVVMPPVGSSRVTNQLPWRYTTPTMPWYKDVRVFESLQDYHRSKMRGT